MEPITRRAALGAALAVPAAAALAGTARAAGPTEVQAILSGKTTPAEAVRTAQKNADELLRPYVEQTALKQTS